MSANNASQCCLQKKNVIEQHTGTHMINAPPAKQIIPRTIVITPPPEVSDVVSVPDGATVNPGGDGGAVHKPVRYGGASEFQLAS